jgi:diguanylate cyclase (GGDEF)-like protein/PAS domain S-box-containing protein
MKRIVNILIVEDQQDSRYLLTKLLESSGFTVVTATNGKEALDRLRADRFDLIISDILMPVMDGFRLCHAVKSDPMLQAIPFVFYTATYTAAEDEALAYKAGASLFIRKPVEPEAFMVLIRNIVDDVCQGDINAASLETQDAEIFKLYDERLIRKLEHKMQALEHEVAERKRVEERLRLLSTAVEQSPVSVVITDQEANIQYVNPRFIEVTGYTEKEVIGQNPRILQSKLTLESTYQEMWDMLTSGRVWQGTLVNQRKNGEIYWEDVHIAPVKDSAGEFNYYVGVKLDITEQKLANDAIQQLSQKLQGVLDAATEVAIIATDVKGVITLFNRGAERILGFDAEEMVDKQTPELFHLQEEINMRGQELTTELGYPVSGFKVFVAKAETDGQERREWTYVHKDGTRLWVSLVITTVRSEDEVITGYLGIAQDITARKQAEEELQLAAMVYQNTSEGMMIVDANNCIIAINPAFTEITGFTREEAVGQDPKFLSSGRQPAKFYQDMWRAINTSGQWQGEIWNRHKNDEVYVEWLTINTIYGTNDEVVRRVGLFSDITQKKEDEELIWTQANFDPLTGLPNRRMFHDRLQQEIRKAHRAHLPLALMFLDLDHFKEINDTLGHGMGDQLLKEVTQRLSHCLRETDTVARLGGDEFIIILNELDKLDSTERVAQEILQKLAEPYQLEDENVYISASIGITLFPTDAGDADTLLKNADQAMYAAKTAGRSRFSYFTQSMQDSAQARMRLTNDLRGALANNQFLIFYQPIVELKTGAIQKAEALIRWQHPSRGIISPAEFIPIAEDTGLIVEIGDWVFHQVANQVMQWRDTYNAEFQISINKSPVQFQRDLNLQHHEEWLNYMRQLGLPGQSITVEITEGLLLDANPAVTEQLLSFRDAGIPVSLDDFGTGYSSLSYLKKFDIDFIKIDQSFTRNLTPDSDDMVLCEAIIVMAHKLGNKVIAEGVETAEQRDLLITANCDYGQGYLFSRPVPAREFERILTANTQ